MKTKLILIISLFAIQLHAQNPINVFFKNKQYAKIGSIWKLYHNEGFYNIDNRIVTLKFNSNVTAVQRETLATNYNLVPKGNTLSGWYDYDIGANVDLFPLLQNITNNAIVKDVVINTEIWLNSVPNDPMCLANGKDINVVFNKDEQLLLEVTTAIDGYKAFDSVNVHIQSGSITAIIPNPVVDIAEIQYTLDASYYNAYCIVTNGFTTQVYSLSVANNSINIDCTNLPPSAYNIILVANGNLLDNKTFLKQ